MNTLFILKTSNQTLSRSVKNKKSIFFFMNWIRKFTFSWCTTQFSLILMFCAIKPLKLNQSKEKTANQDDKSERKSRRIQSFSEQHKTFPYDKNENKNQNHFQNKNKKNDYKGGHQKKISRPKTIHKVADYGSEYDEKWTSAKRF